MDAPTASLPRSATPEADGLVQLSTGARLSPGMKKPASAHRHRRIWVCRFYGQAFQKPGWFDPAEAPWAGGLGFTEPVPDRTVSGNGGMVVGYWGAS